MMPFYSYMDSHPFQKNQMPFAHSHYPHPGIETIPYHVMNMDPTEPHVPHDPRPNAGHGFGYGYPMSFYSCCNGGNFPSYSCFRPPHQHLHCYGGYPPFQYVPSHHYSVEEQQHPRYEFDKNMLRTHHYCGCPNSLCKRNQKEDRSIKIEEENPDIPRDRSFFPIQFGNNQRPIVWIPPDHMESKREREPFETETVRTIREDDGSNLSGNLKSLDKGPEFWSGWPLSDMNRPRSWLPNNTQGVGAQRVQNNLHEDGTKSLPFPIVWMPAFGGEGNVGKDVQTMNTTEETAELNRNDEKCISEDGPEVVKTSKQRSIPVKEMNCNKTEDTETKKEMRCIPVKTLEDNVERESSSGTNVKEESSSSPKKPKLVPVCLRVDPFPRKKNSNSNSRSDSPPKEMTSSTQKKSSPTESKINDGTLIGSVPLEPESEKVVKLVEVKSHENLNGNRGDEDEDDISSSEEPLSLPKNSQDKSLDQLCKEETREESVSGEHGEEDRTRNGDASIEKAVVERLETSSVGLVGDEKKTEKTSLSDEEAAMLIQSAYRGYEVRKLELLKKLRQIADVHQQVIEVRNRVKALESAPQDEKQRVLIGEMIMRLLLKLDTIQGLHSSVREFRKSLAKELVALQETVDCIMTNNPTEPAKEVLTDKSAEDCDVASHDDKTEQEQNKDEVIGIGEIFSEGVNEYNNLLVQVNEAQPLCGIDEMRLGGMESPVKNEPERLAEDGFKELPEVKVENTQVSEAEQLAELKESGFENEDTSNLSSQNSSQPLSEDGKVVVSEMWSEKPEESESGGETEPDVKVTDVENRIDEVSQIDIKEEAANEPAGSCEAEDSFEIPSLNLLFDDQLEGVEAEGVPDKETASTSEENGQTENLMAVDIELPMREVENSTDRFEADKLEHIEGTKDVLQVENDLAIKSSSSGDRFRNEKQLDEHEGYCAEIGSEQHEGYLNYSMNEVENKGAPNESRDLTPELSNYTDDKNTENDKLAEENEQQNADKVEKLVEGLQGCQVDVLPTSKLEKQAYESHTAEEETMVVTSIERGAGSMHFSPDGMQESIDKIDLVRSEREMDRKLVEENEQMRKMVEKLIEAGEEQLTLISKLNGRVKDLEKRLARKKKPRRGCYRSKAGSPMLSRRIKASNS